MGEELDVSAISENRCLQRALSGGRSPITRTAAACRAPTAGRRFRPPRDDSYFVSLGYCFSYCGGIGLSGLSPSQTSETIHQREPSWTSWIE